MRLSEMAKELGVAAMADAEVRAVRDDSRAVSPGDVFVAVRGITTDGHKFVDAAIARGAGAIVVEERVPGATVPQLVVPSAARALGVLASVAAGKPADRMRLVGVTGTNGKTTTTYLVESMLAAAGREPGVVGTVSARYGGRELPSEPTTPTPLALHALFADMLAAGTTDVVMETSSAALAQDRLEGVTFRVAAFTNLTQDHLDVHKTMDAYFDAKARLFGDRLATDGVAVANVDDPRGDEMLARFGGRKLRVSVRGSADVCVATRSLTIAGLAATLRTPRGPLDVRSPALLGEYNLANVALAVGIGEALELDRDAIARGIEGLAGVPGRVERVRNARGVDAFVDYAHTPDALERVIAALRPLTPGRLICVFGCGGDRDRTKRPKMGRIVSRDADLAIVTSDNPRTEDPHSIICMILDGIEDRAKTMVEPDRRAAIALAVGKAQPGDVILIAGKGHEDYQIVGKTKIHFDDREEAANAIAASRQV